MVRYDVVKPRERVRIDRWIRSIPSTLAEDVKKGLGTRPKELSPKYFYDARGSRIFDAICRTPEYYPTRCEEALLSEQAEPLLDELRPTLLLELGSGSPRKARIFLRAAEKLDLEPRYAPFDVSGSALEESALQLTDEFSWLQVHGVVGDFHRHLSRAPSGGRRLVAFLGGTIGNFQEEEAVAFLRSVAAMLEPGDRFLLGADVVKDPAVLNAAYNDAEGLTAAFNTNMLRVINRELDADFDLDDFEHLAFYREDEQQIEMHLRSLKEQQVRVGKLDMEISFDEGETIRTEVSRKFTKETMRRLLEKAGMKMERWITLPDESFSLTLARV